MERGRRYLPEGSKILFDVAVLGFIMITSQGLDSVISTAADCNVFDFQYMSRELSNYFLLTPLSIYVIKFHVTSSLLACVIQFH